MRGEFLAIPRKATHICGDYRVFFHLTSVKSLAWHPLRPVPVLLRDEGAARFTPATGPPAVQGLKVPTVWYENLCTRKKYKFGTDRPHQIMIDVWEGPTSNSVMEAKRGCTTDFSSIKQPNLYQREIILLPSQFTKLNRWRPRSHEQLISDVPSCCVLIRCSLQRICLVSHPCSPPPPWCFGQPAVCWEFSTLDSTIYRQPSVRPPFIMS